MDLLRCFSQLSELGKDRLQELCDGWLTTPMAREASVTMVLVGDDLSFDFATTFFHSFHGNETYHFPADDLLHYLAENGVEDAKRAELVSDIAAKRKAGGVEVYQRFDVRTETLYLTCKTPGCGNIMQDKLPRGARPSFTGECPRCGSAHKYCRDDYRKEP